MDANLLRLLLLTMIRETCLHTHSKVSHTAFSEAQRLMNGTTAKEDRLWPMSGKRFFPSELGIWTTLVSIIVDPCLTKVARKLKVKSAKDVPSKLSQLEDFACVRCREIWICPAHQTTREMQKRTYG